MGCTTFELSLLARNLDVADSAVSNLYTGTDQYLSFWQNPPGSGSWGPYLLVDKPNPASNFPYGVNVEPDRI